MREERDRERERKYCESYGVTYKRPFEKQPLSTVDRSNALKRQSSSLPLSLSPFPSFFLSASDLSSTRDSIVLSRSTGTRPRAAVNFYLSVRSCPLTSLFLPRMKTNIFLRDASIREDFSQSNGIIRLFFFLIKIFQLLKNLDIE